MILMEKCIDFFGQPALIACDCKCQMAWGIAARPKIQLNEKIEEDYVFLSDSEVGPAPESSCTCKECGAKKPSSEAEFLASEYCIGECERRNLLILDGPEEHAEPYDFSTRVYNIPELHGEGVGYDYNRIGSAS